MGIRKIIAIGLGFIALSAQAAPTTNSWTYMGANPNSYYWDNGPSWSLTTYPTIANAADFITNIVTKTVVIDDFDTFPSLTNCLVVSNVTIDATGATTNAFLLDSINDGTNLVGGLPIPFHILNGLTVGTGGVVQVTNSVLQVDGKSGGTVQINGGLQLFDGALVVVTNATISPTAVLWFALGTASTSSPVVVSNNLTLGGTLNVMDGGGFTNTTYTLFTYAGTLTYSGVTIGSVPDNTTCTISTGTVGQVDLIVTAGSSSNAASPQIISISRNLNDITVMWTMSAAGTNFVQAGNSDPNGVYDTNNYQNVVTNIVSAGVTNSYTDVGGVTNRPSRFYRILYSH